MFHPDNYYSSNNIGLFVEPAAATTFAGLLHNLKDQKIPDYSDNLILLTGSGLKDLKAVNKTLNIPKVIEANVENLPRF